MSDTTSDEILAKLVSRTNRVVFTYDVEAARFTFLNKAFSDVWQRTTASVLANPAILLESVHPDDLTYLEKEYRDLLHGVLKNQVEMRVLLPDKSVRWLMLYPELILSQSGQQFIAGFADDITMAKDNINSLEKYGAKKNSVLEILSHDLAGPLANTRSLAELLRESTKKYENAEVNKIIHIIRESAERSVRLIRDFVQQEFLESAQSDLMKRRVNLVNRLLEIIGQYKEGADHIQKDIRFTTSSQTVYASVDENKFMQVINNLLSNAIKFTPDNGVISVDLQEQEETVVITVKDNGIGIPKQYHDELFEKFTQARRQGLRGEPTTGLGMSIIKTIVEWHNGRIWFESEEDKGTTFFIEIPKN
ncbi:PAS domain-containing sensor histidine kinase [Pontibacter litorisediminis]|uniref:PAS domain-containing sensor histidine kinase n=1 Tax=Pontibacter litorisediminis TaxID=1846260 RepID=UPI0023ED5B04|nr:PAS domain-containing sensor histidine kinase [Pontibacter litorisediminis]